MAMGTRKQQERQEGFWVATALLHDSTLARVRPFSQPLVHDTTA